MTRFSPASCSGGLSNINATRAPLSESGEEVMLLSFLDMVFWICTGLVLYVYAAYPAILWLLTRGRQAPVPSVLSDDNLPAISMIIAVYNEEVVIEDKIRNCLKLDYPDGKLMCLFVSDSTDRTNELLLKHKEDRIDVQILPERRGKAAALAAAVPRCTGEILVFSDANTLYHADALKKLVRHFADPQIGGSYGRCSAFIVGSGIRTGGEVIL